MGTLDDAIREHLELKRRHGAGDAEIREAEAEAFGPGEEVDEVPGAAVTTPAGEGDQLDKVFSPMEPPAEPVQEEELAESSPVAEAPAPSPEAVAPVEEMTVESEAVESDLPAVGDADEEVDAGDALERERDHLVGHPTENYDVDAAIAEEEELDLLNESRLSDELDRALGGPEEIPPAPAPIESVEEPIGDEADSAEIDLGEPSVPAGEVIEEEIDVEEEVAIVEEEIDEVALEPEPEPISEDPIPEDSDSGEIPLDDTPDFLEDSPDGEDLWFEQKEPKDFDFGD